MLHWRLLIGIPLVAALIGLCCLDARMPIPGVILIPVFLICVYFLCREILLLLRAGGIFPRRSTVYLGIFGTIVLCWLSSYNSLPFLTNFENALTSALRETSDPAVQKLEQQTTAAPAPADDELGQAADAVQAAKQALAAAERALNAAQKLPQGEEEEEKSEAAPILKTTPAPTPRVGLAGENEWNTAAFAGLHILLAIAAGVLIAFIGEMLRFKQPGGNIINLTGAVFAIVYIGLLGSFMVLLRVAYGVEALVSMIIVAKLCDIGAYTVGRLFGRHKMAPSLSPGKTIEGACGGVAFSILGAWLSVAFLFPLANGGTPSQTTWIGIVVYGVAVGLAGAIGDLAESLIKRDVMRKDSGVNVPGFGGFLDIFDSLLIAGPVAFGLWAFHLIQ